MNPVTIIQARTGGSTRFGSAKVLEDICGKTMLERVIERAKLVRTVSASFPVVLAVPATLDAHCLYPFAIECGCGFYAGSEDDVLNRYYEAAKAFDADPIIRITADCPLIDPEIISGMLSVYKRGGFDMVANNFVRTMPHGLDAEVFSFESLEYAAHNAVDQWDKEHVSPCIRRKCVCYNWSMSRDVGSWMRWTVDYPEDIAFMRAVYERLPWNCSWKDVVALIEREPWIGKINEHKHVLPNQDGF